MFCQEAQSYLFQVSDSQGCKQPENLCCNPNMLECWLFSDFGLPALNTELQCQSWNLTCVHQPGPSPVWETLPILSVQFVLSTLLGLQQVVRKKILETASSVLEGAESEEQLAVSPLTHHGFPWVPEDQGPGQTSAPDTQPGALGLFILCWSGHSSPNCLLSDFSASPIWNSALTQCFIHLSGLNPCLSNLQHCPLGVLTMWFASCPTSSIGPGVGHFH